MPIATAEVIQTTLKTKRRKAADRYLVAAILTALTLRLIVVCCYYHCLPDADKNYEQFGWEIGWVARAWASGHGFSSPFFPLSGPTALVPPLYPAMLAGVFRLFGIYTLTSGFIILTINSVLSALTCIPVYFSAKESLGLRGAQVACWGWAVYPFAIYFSAGRVWEYSLTVLLFTTCFCILQRIHRIRGTAKPLAWLGLGLLYGVTALSNPSVLSMLPFLLALALWKVHKSGRPWLLNGALTIAGVLIVITPWMVRNYRELHVVSPIRDNFWLEFYAGNFGDTSDPNPSSAHPASSPAEMKKFLAMGETRYLAEKHILAVEYVRQHPAFFGYVTARRVLYYWTGFWSFSSDYRQREPFEIPLIFFDVGMALLMLRGIGRFWRWNFGAVLPYLVLIAVFPLTYYITHPLMDYRQPIEPAIVVLAIAGAVPFKSLRRENWTGAEQAKKSS